MTSVPAARTSAPARITPRIAAVLAAAAMTALPPAASSAPPAAARPNIVLMLADDQGWNGLSVEMSSGVAGSRSTIHRTPRLERLAAQGMRFSMAYAPAPVCSPTRISIQTGRSPAALHWTKAAPAERGHRLLEPTLVKAIADDEATIGAVLSRAGYATAHYGKWHIAGGGPGRHGYDEHDGDTGNEQAYEFTDPNPVDIFGMARRAESFMDKSRREGRPFFVQLSWNALHAAENALAATRAKYAHLGDAKRAAVAAITEDLDTGVGMVLDAIDRLGLAGTTYVIYTSDNGAGGGGGGNGKGGGGRRSGLSGGKGSLFEGGIRVPFILRGPGVAANSWCEVPIVGYDLFPTFCEWAGVPRSALPAGLEGGSIAPVAAAGGTGRVARPTDEIVFHFPHYQSGHTPHSVIRTDRLKLFRFYEDDSVRLYDLDDDPAEARDLAAARPADAARLRRLLDSRLAAVHAKLPTPNPQFDPANPAPEQPRGGKGGGMKGDKKPRKKPA